MFNTKTIKHFYQWGRQHGLIRFPETIIKIRPLQKNYLIERLNMSNQTSEIQDRGSGNYIVFLIWISSAVDKITPVLSNL